MHFRPNQGAQPKLGSPPARLRNAESAEKAPASVRVFDFQIFRSRNRLAGQNPAFLDLIFIEGVIGQHADGTLEDLRHAAAAVADKNKKNETNNGVSDSVPNMKGGKFLLF